MKPDIAILIREKDTSKETLGTLQVIKGGATFVCHTLELPWKSNKPNISCIPKGTYQVSWTFSPRFLKFTYEVKNVPKRSGIRLHSANYFTDLLGCIALGKAFVDLNHDGELDIINSRITRDAFEGFMQRQPFTLIIK